MLAALQAELNAFKAAFEAEHGRAPERSDLRPVRMKLALYSKATRELRARTFAGDTVSKWPTIGARGLLGHDFASSVSPPRGAPRTSTN